MRITVKHCTGTGVDVSSGRDRSTGVFSRRSHIERHSPINNSARGDHRYQVLVQVPHAAAESSRKKNAQHVPNAVTPSDRRLRRLFLAPRRTTTVRASRSRSWKKGQQARALIHVSTLVCHGLYARRKLRNPGNLYLIIGWNNCRRAEKLQIGFDPTPRAVGSSSLVRRSASNMPFFPTDFS